jgi:MFS family permease
MMAGFGAIYSYAAFAEPIADAFGVDRAAVAVVFALSGGSCFLTSAVSGPLGDHLGTRAMATIGMVLVAIGLIVAASARDLLGVHLGFGLLTGIGVGFAYVPAMAAVQRAFVARRGLASGIAVSGIGIGTAAVPLASDLLAAFGDWRKAFLISGLAVAIVGSVGAMLLPAGSSAPRRRLNTPGLPVGGLALAWVGTLLVSLPAVLPHAALVSSASDLGLPRSEALGLLGVIGVGTIIGRFLLAAAAADALGHGRIFFACCGTMAASMALWVAAADIWGLRGFALVFGVAQGGFVALLPVFIADRFGTAQLGTAMGLLYTSRGIAFLTAPAALMVAIDLSGPVVPMLSFGGLGLAGTLVLAFRMNRTDSPDRLIGLRQPLEPQRLRVDLRVDADHPHSCIGRGRADADGAAAA